MIITKDILDKEVAPEMMPTRLDSALNLYTHIKNNDENGIIVYNTNPDTWNCLYPFYELNHKFTLDDYEFSKKDITYRELIEEYMEVYKKIYENELGYIKDLRINILLEEFKKTFEIDDVNIGDELTPIFELKYSKTKNVWTLYYFENYVASNVDSINKLFEQNLYQQYILPLDSKITEIDGVSLTTNTPYLLSIPENITILKDNLIDMKSEN